MWRQIFGSDGLVNQSLALVGVHGPSWISDPRFAVDTLVLLAVWQVGAPMIIFLAGLKEIPVELYEAATVDGASPWRQFRSITLPLITPLIFFNLVLQVIGSFQAFNPAYIISGGTGGPVDSTLFYTLYLYYQAFIQMHMGYASAMAWVLLLIIAGATAVNFLGSRYWVFYQDREERA
jgi:multiple sugar transport system permease protein